MSNLRREYVIVKNDSSTNTFQKLPKKFTIKWLQGANYMGQTQCNKMGHVPFRKTGVTCENVFISCLTIRSLARLQ